MSACMLISRSSEALRLLLSIVRAARPGPIDPLLVQRGRGTGFPRQHQEQGTVQHNSPLGSEKAPPIFGSTEERDVE